MIKDLEDLESSPDSELSPGSSSDDDVNSEELGEEEAVRAVPYERLQREVSKREQLEQELQDVRDRLAAAEKPKTRAPSETEDPVGYAQYVANEAREAARSAKEELAELKQEQERQRTLQGLFREFDSAMEKYPALNNDEFRDFAWEQFCIGKDKSQGKATGVKILKELDDRLGSYGGRPKTPRRERQEHLRGKPKDTRPERHEFEGERRPLKGKKSLRQKLDDALKAKREGIMERFKQSEKRTAGL